MEYIKCSHCGKKYNVTDKVRSFVGREIKCKACNEKFPIIIHIAPDKNTTEKPEQQTTQEQPHTDEELQAIIEKVETTKNESEEDDTDSTSSEPNSKDKKKEKTKKNLANQLQLYLSIFLVICLLAGLSFLLFMENQDPIPPTTSIQPVELEEPMPEFANTEKEIVKEQEVKTSFSEACKKAAAAQWLIDHNMVHGQLTNEQYMDFMDLSQEQSAKVREICGDDNVVQQVLQAARNKIKPAWIRSEIRILQE